MDPSQKIPYQLGFRTEFSLGKIWSSDHDVFVGIELTSEWTDAAFEEYDSLITSFFMLANSGALSAPTTMPWLSRIDGREALSARANRASFALRGCNLSDVSTILCANMISIGHRQFPVVHLSIISDEEPLSPTGFLKYDVRQIDPYPEIVNDLPFPYTIEYDTTSPTLIINFADTLDESARMSIRSHLLAWLAACADGVYAAPLAPPRDCFILSSPSDISFNGSEMTFEISDLRCHEAVLRGLVNSCAVLHGRTMEIESLSIE